jgi:hypothetical protein
MAERTVLLCDYAAETVARLVKAIEHVDLPAASDRAFFLSLGDIKHESF